MDLLIYQVDQYFLAAIHNRMLLIINRAVKWMRPEHCTFVWLDEDSNWTTVPHVALKHIRLFNWWHSVVAEDNILLM